MDTVELLTVRENFALLKQKVVLLGVKVCVLNFQIQIDFHTQN